MVSLETIEHIKALDWIRHHHPELGRKAIHIANERNTSPWYGSLLKRMGVRKGAADLLWLIPYQGFHGLLIEIKTKNGIISKEQQKFLDETAQDGYACYVARGAQEVIDRFCEYFWLPYGAILNPS